MWLLVNSIASLSPSLLLLGEDFVYGLKPKPLFRSGFGFRGIKILKYRLCFDLVENKRSIGAALLSHCELNV